MPPNLINKLFKIGQGNAVWQCTVRRAPLWIVPKNSPPYRPFILLVLDQDSEMILQTEILENHPDPQLVLNHLFKAMQGSLFNLRARQRPACVSMDDAELAQACAPQLAALGIRCEQRASLPQINAALLEIEAQANRHPPFPGLLSIPGVSVPLAAELYAAAAEYYHQAPWRLIENTMPIEARYPADGPALPGSSVRYALVLGSGGEFFGLSLYDSIADLEAVFSSTGPDQHLDSSIIWLSLILEKATTMSFADLDAIERYDWPVAGDRAYPLVLKASSDEDFSQRPTAADIAWMAAALRAIPSFLSQQLGDGQLPSRAQASFPLPLVHGNQYIALRFLPFGVAPDGDSWAQDQDPELEAFIADWHWDEKSHEFSRQMGAFLLQFLDYLAESNLSEKTVRKHESNCWLIGSFEAHYGGHDTFAATIFLGGPSYIEEFTRKVSNSPAALNSFRSTWRKLEKYIYSLGYDDPYKKKA